MASIYCCPVRRLGAYYIRGYLKGAEQRGYDPENILCQANIPPDVYDNDGATITGEQLQRLILTIREVMNDHYMGFLKVPGKLTMDQESGRAAVQGQTLGEGIHKLVDFINAVRSDEIRWCHFNAMRNEFSLGFRFTELNVGMDQHLLYAYRMYWGYKFYCWLTGQRIPLTRACFSSPRPPHSIDYSDMFKCPIQFSQQVDCLCFDQKHLGLPVIRNEVELNSGDYPCNYPDWFQVPGNDQRVSSQVEQLLTDLQAEKIYSPTVKMVASRLCMTPRTLTRRLNEENTSYSRIKAKVRCALAQRYLTQSTMPITWIAGETGFSTSTHFVRAFFSWTGETPYRYRRGRLSS